jgi:ribonucrease Y
MGPYLALFLGLALGAGLGYALRIFIALSQKKSIELDLKQMTLDAKAQAQKIIEEAEAKAESKLEEIKKEEKETEAELKKHQERLIKKEELLDTRQRDLDHDADELKEREEKIIQQEKSLETSLVEHQEHLARIAGLTLEEARQELYASLENQYAEDIQVRMQKLETMAQEKLERRAKEILTTTIHRLASSTASEVTTTHVQIPSDDIKGKIIGKEGRNIRSFERAAGVELIVDDTPDAIIISSFDPIRRQIARVALENLILDGRIQPAKIEEFIESARKEINQIIKEKGEQAVLECGIYSLDPRVVSILGRLYFRTSYGQNVLQHSIEMAHLAGMLAEELGADVMIAKTGALVHDIGKALDHEVQGTHIEIGIRILQKFGVDERVITAMKSHHDDYPHETVEAVIVQVCDMISGSRPGARRDTVENYLKRLRELESVAGTFTGVERAYALSAGREIRVFVYPDQVSDLEARETARNMALRIEQELRYPGEIKITVIRENRIIEFAR